MRAIGFLTPGDPSVLTDVELPDPVPGPRDLLVEVRAVSVNPVDTKVRTRPVADETRYTVPGYDAVGVVRATGTDVTGFRPGDRVWYAGVVNRPGTNAELHLVDERIAALPPESLDDEDAAAMPLTTITAWELLFDRLDVPRGGGDGRTLLVVGAAGGVGSMLVQLASALTELTVVATASRPETADWVRGLGADHVVDHRDLTASLHAAGFDSVDLIASLTHSDTHFPSYAGIVAPQGRVAIIDDPAELDIRPLKPKSVSVHWESMFTRAVFATPDMAAQGELLRQVADLVDKGALRTTRTTTRHPIDAATLRDAHATQETGRSIGKTVIAGWPPR